jgi:hypothetical protein
MNVHSLSNPTSQIYYIFLRCLPEKFPSLDSDEVQPSTVTRVEVASDRGDPGPKHVAAIYFKISCPILSPLRDATQPA